jgi:predicted RNase H-like HicB family nuclease
MENAELDSLRDSYKAAVEKWIAAIHEEENLATPDHTVPAVDAWEHAGFSEEEARTAAKEAKKAYENALRNVNFNF